MKNKFIGELKQNPELRKRFLEDPEEVLAHRKDLSEEEKALILSHDEGSHDDGNIPVPRLTDSHLEALAPWIPNAAVVTGIPTQPLKIPATGDLVVTFGGTFESSNGWRVELRNQQTIIKGRLGPVLVGGPLRGRVEATFRREDCREGVYCVYAVNDALDCKIGPMDRKITLEPPAHQ
jgi:hypothetical protein